MDIEFSHDYSQIPHLTPHMASIQKTARGWRAQVYANGQRASKVFRTQREAKVWAETEAQRLRTQAALPLPERHTLAEACHRYAAEVAPTKRGARRERICLTALEKQPTFPAGETMGNLTPALFARWRDARLKQVAAGTVLREITVISAVLEVARREWGWLTENPLREIRKPRQPDHREVVLSPTQVMQLLRAMKYSPRKPVRSVAQSVAVAMLFALRTGMRAGEICGLTWDRVKADYCVLPVTKTVPRNVPLTAKALRLIGRMAGYDPVLVFGLSSQSLDANFRKYRQRAGIEGVTFHDTRHTAATMMARKVDALTLCKIFGWSTTTQALTYFNPTASEIAKRL